MCQDEKKRGRSWPSKIGYIHPEIGGVPYPSKTVPHFPTGILLGFFSIVYIYLYIYICVCVTQSNFAVDNFQAQR